MTPATTVHSPHRLYGRNGELVLLDRMLSRLRQGRGSTLVLTAPPGLGRSALARHAVEGRREGAVLHTRAAPAEATLACSGLHALLCSAIGPLPPEADDATRAGTAPTALLGLLRALGARGPLLVCVDDAHAWDRDSRVALGFAARRLAPGDRVAVLLTAGDEPGGRDAFTGLPRLRLGPLDDTAAGALLDHLTDGRTDPVVRDALRREAGGNPRLLTALTGRLTPDQLAGHAPLPHPLPGAEAVLDAYAARTRALPADTRLLLLIAAAAEEHEPEGAGADAALLLRAARPAGLDLGRLQPAERAGVLRGDGTRLHFAHPLLRTAVLRGAPLPSRRAAHRLLAAALDGPHPARARLVQLACATGGHDPALADALAGAAAAPGPHTDRATALERAAELTADDTLRGVRFAVAAEHAWLGGDPGRARALLTRVRTAPALGHAPYVRGLLALCDGPVADAHAFLLAAAALLADYDTARTTAALLAAAEAAWAMGDAPAYAAALARVPTTSAAKPAPGPPQPPGVPVPLTPRGVPGCPSGPSSAADAPPSRPASGPPLRRQGGGTITGGGARDGAESSPAAGAGAGPGGGGTLGLYVAGMRDVFGGRTADGHGLLRRCVEAGERGDDPDGLLRSAAAALVVGDVDTACPAGARALAAVRVHGPQVLLPQALEHLAYGELRAGRHARARVHAEEGLRAAGRLGRRNAAAHLHAVLALIASVEGDARACAEHADAAAAVAAAHGLAQAGGLAVWAVGRAGLAAGRCAEAAARLGPLVGPGPRRGHFAVRMLAVPCFVEAAVLAGRAAGAAVAVEEFRAWAASTADPLAPAQLARCRALLAPPEEAAARYEEALAHHDRAGGDFERGRTLLLYGQWLRRRRRTSRARGPLRDALVAFERCGARVWAERAQGELRAAGEAVAGDTGGGPLARLTPQQRRIAHHVAEGATNREVALRLSVSTRTVDHHLRNVFALLQVRSRTELARLLDRSGS
ncbi:LuxR family transcriptional regulator [Streptomyces peucetius]|uniref:LuxR family transcriptional regulator n=1 Tax=Streptomyces peucetius TaxID=1950 RepID=A0ABY6I777_STRPE|nr:LuxR family transcriptional regulator [Streptomyces peucetius]UYQ61585.1 LuxR family transcriptional regulator [Streptomyces peucetius]